MASEFRTQMIWKMGLIVALVAASAVALALRGVRRGLDLQGGTELQYVIRYRGPDAGDITSKTIDIIERRVDPHGTMEMDIRPVGHLRFAIRLPGMSVEEARIIEQRVQRAGRLLFCLVNTDVAAIDKASAGREVPGYAPFVLEEVPAPGQPKGGKMLRHYRRADFRDLPKLKLTRQNWYGLPQGGREAMLVSKRPEIEGDKLDPASIHETSDRAGQRAIGFSFLTEGRSQFAYITERNKGKYLAIILDEVLYSAPVIQNRIVGPGVITSGDGFDPEESRDLIVTLKSGSLPADIDLEWRHSIGPELGEDSIRAGVRASIIGLAVVVAIIAGYYLASGLIAVFALTLNALLVLGAMAAFNTTMTLPGIAGLILTLGMADDANVLICERIREEKALGKTIRLAVKTGYDRAFITIIDSNLTTLITAIILYFVGTGPVKGFAIVLSIGIIASIFTSVFVTRTITELLMSVNVLQKLSMFQLFRRTQIGFTRIRHVAMACSLAFIIVGMVVFIRRGEQKYDSDLLGGFMAEMELQNPMTLDEFRGRVAAAGYPKASIQSLWAVGATAGEKAKLFSIRVRKLDEEQAMGKVEEDLRGQLETAGLFKQIERTSPWQYRIALSRPITESDLRAQLKAAGFDPAQIARLGSSQRDSQFILRLGPELQGNELNNAVQEAQKALGKLVATRVRRFSAGAVERVQESEGAEVWRLELNFNESVPRQALEETLRRSYEAARKDRLFRVAGAGRDEGAEVCLHVRVESADRALLEQLAAIPDKTLTVPHFISPQAGVIELETAAPVTEDELRKALGAPLAAKVQAILPKVAAADEFAAEFAGTLKEATAQEKIREDLEREFKGELARRKLEVEFTPIESAPDFVKYPEDLVKDGYAFVEMNIKDPATSAKAEVPLQLIAENLRQAGHEDALLIEGSLREQGQSAASRVYLKFKPPLDKFESDVRNTFSVPDPFRRLQSVGGRVSGEMKNAAFWAAVLSLMAMLVYIWLRFGTVRFGVGAVVALAHDVLATLGAVAIADALAGTAIGARLGFAELKINLVMIGAFLTLVGYSVNDTIVVFDRIRENMGGRRGKVDPDVVDRSINQTLSRTILTSLTTFAVVFVLYLVGGPVVHGFGFVLSFGIIVGTYSSIFIASPILLDWQPIMGFLRQVFRAITFQFLRSPRRA